MLVLKVTLEGMTTSFRYPHFMVGVQPTFPMPPPATIYGLISSTLGRWFDPQEVEFAYHFTTQGKAVDVEHIHVLAASGGKLPDTDLPKVLEGNINPFRRELLFQPRLVLYINRPEWKAAFRSPVYPVALGRSQDLCSYSRVDILDLAERSNVYLEHTLLPYEMATRTETGIVTIMPRFIDYTQNRRPAFARYLLLQRRIFSRDLLRFDSAESRFFADPETPLVDDLPLGLVFHTFIGERHETLTMAGLPQ